ncbi:MAG TPA: phosphoglycerate mutase family protein [Geothrix sp.]|nr:phosphoglycerate mutase family protein [Geothrix sp.]
MLRSLHRLVRFACGFAFALGLGAQDTTVVLLRHAERQSLWDGDSPLAASGRQRAQALVPSLASFKPTALYASDLERTQQTLAPLAAALVVKPQIRTRDASEALAAEILREQRGRTVVVCWHHDLMKKVVRGLGVKGPVPYWSLDVYDWLWIVRVPAKGVATLETRRQELAPGPAGVAQGR